MAAWWCMIPKASGRAIVWLSLFGLSFLSMERTNTRMMVAMADPPMADVIYEGSQSLFIHQTALQETENVSGAVSADRSLLFPDEASRNQKGADPPETHGRETTTESLPLPPPPLETMVEPEQTAPQDNVPPSMETNTVDTPVEGRTSERGAADPDTVSTNNEPKPRDEPMVAPVEHVTVERTPEEPTSVEDDPHVAAGTVTDHGANEPAVGPETNNGVVEQTNDETKRDSVNDGADNTAEGKKPDVVQPVPEKRDVVEPANDENRDSGEPVKDAAKPEDVVPAKDETKNVETASDGETQPKENKDVVTVESSNGKNGVVLFPPSEDEKNSVVVKWDGFDAMNAFVDSIWTGNLFCKTLADTRDALEQQEQDPTRPNPHNNWMTIQMSFSCEDLFLRSDSGTGNFIMALYMMRFSAGYKGNVTLDMSCTDAEDTKASLILPWLMSRRTLKPDPVAHTQLEADLKYQVWDVWSNSCDRFVNSPLGLIVKDMQYDFRKMAVALVGARPNHPSTLFAEQYLYPTIDPTETWKRGDIWNMTSSITPQLANPTRSDPPLVPNVELDDAVIHFRCGDVLLTDLVSYGFMKFDSYVRHLSHEARTIGILTQPFGDEGDDGDQQRRQHDSDKETSRRCRVLVTDLKSYIEERHPQAVVSIRNDPSETISIAYARLIMANESVAAMSTFSVYPIVATFGTGYFLRPEGSQPNAWLHKYPKNYDLMTGRRNVHLFEIDDESLRVGAATRNAWNEKGDEHVLQWFRGRI